MDLLKKGFGKRNHNRHLLNLLQCSNPASIPSRYDRAIEANYFNNLKINKQSLLRQLKIKQENMQVVGMTQLSRRWRLA